MANKDSCIAYDYFPNKCTGKNTGENRTIIFKLCDKYGEEISKSNELVSLCSFHYEWLKTINNLEMIGETIEEAIEDDLLENFTNNDIYYYVWKRENNTTKGQFLNPKFYLLEGNQYEKDKTPLEGDEYRWELKGMFYYDEFTKKLFEIEKISEPKLIYWLMFNKIYFEYPPKFSSVYVSKETHDKIKLNKICDDDDDINNDDDDDDDDYFTDVVKNDEDIYTDIDSEFKMGKINPDINDYFRKKYEEVDFREYIKCLYFIRQHASDITKWSTIYPNCHLSDEKIYERVLLLKEALVLGNKLTIEYLKCLSSDDNAKQLHVIMWIVYISTNHELYCSNTFSKIPGTYTLKEKKGYTDFFKNLVDLFVEQGLVKPLLCLAISGERQRYVCHHHNNTNPDYYNQREYRNVVQENFEVVQIIVPCHINARDTIIYNNKDNKWTAFDYWKGYDNKLFYRHFISKNDDKMYEEFDKNIQIGEYLEDV